MPTIREKRQTFRTLHEAGCFVIPNPWDIGSARYLQSLGFRALATTSSGAAYSLGLPDGGMPRDAMLAHIRGIVEASDLPVNADFVNGFADAPDGVAANVKLCAETGVAGLSIEDQIPGTDRLYDLDHAVARIRAARLAIDAAGGEAFLVGRTECYLTGLPEPLNEAMRRLAAFAAAGADVLYAPGVRSRDEIAALVSAVAPKPLNVLMGWASDLSVDDLAATGVRRISVGGALAKVAFGGFAAAAGEIAATGRFNALAGAKSAGDLDALFAADAQKRGQ